MIAYFNPRLPCGRRLQHIVLLTISLPDIVKSHSRKQKEHLRTLLILNLPPYLVRTQSKNHDRLSLAQRLPPDSLQCVCSQPHYASVLLFGASTAYCLLQKHQRHNFPIFAAITLKILQLRMKLLLHNARSSLHSYCLGDKNADCLFLNQQSQEARL